MKIWNKKKLRRLYEFLSRVVDAYVERLQLIRQANARQNEQSHEAGRTNEKKAEAKKVHFMFLDTDQKEPTGPADHWSVKWRKLRTKAKDDSHGSILRSKNDKLEKGASWTESEK